MDDLEDFRNQRLADEIKGIAEQLASVSGGEGARISERIFVNVFLPFFAGDPDPVYKIGIQHWINTAGSVFSSVAVIDSSGGVLFTVPPLCDRSAVQPVSRDGGPSIAHVGASTNQLANVHPKQGAAYLNNELSKRALIMKVPINVVNHIDVWNKIFTRYGRPPLVKIEGEQTEVESATQDIAKPGDDFDFQPL